LTGDELANAEKRGKPCLEDVKKRGEAEELDK
jgi:hypothetical protein